MNSFALLALACFLNAIICCSLLLFMLKRFVHSDLKYLITFVVYAVLAVLFSGDGNGLLRIDFSTFNYTAYLLYVTGGALVTGLYYFRAVYGRRRMAAANGPVKK